MDYTALRNALRKFCAIVRFLRKNRPKKFRFGSFHELLRTNGLVNHSERFEVAQTKTPCITMGFCILGGYISVFEVQSQRAVMPCD
jgi:hypothetical protein